MITGARILEGEISDIAHCADKALLGRVRECCVPRSMCALRATIYVHTDRVLFESPVAGERQQVAVRVLHATINRVRN